MTKIENTYFVTAVILYLGGSVALRQLGYFGFAAGLTSIFIVVLHRFNQRSGAYARWSPFWVRVINGSAMILSTFFALGFPYDIYKLAGGQ